MLADSSGAAGPVYHWTPGTLPQATSTMIAATSTTSLLYVNQRFFPSPASSYVVQVTLPDGTIASNHVVTSFGTYTNGANTWTSIALTTALSTAPAIGAVCIILGGGIVVFGGVSYMPFPMRVSSYTVSGQGKLPVPRMQIDNTIFVAGMLPLGSALVNQYGDLLGAKVTRLRTLQQFLDGQPNADPTAIIAPDEFLIDRKSLHNKRTIEFELAAAIDQRGIRLPKRQVLANACQFVYRRWNGSSFVAGTCPWAGSTYFTRQGASTTDPAQDGCGKKMTDCKLRYVNENLPFGGFPGVAPVQF